MSLFKPYRKAYHNTIRQVKRSAEYKEALDEYRATKRDYAELKAKYAALKGRYERNVKQPIERVKAAYKRDEPYYNRLFGANRPSKKQASGLLRL